ncbi:hypothetical protein XENTR_v10001479 [Xenopus tropicalis]|nr:hypothetical protein XENTR_v10001479 [Xenopus tropicalis]
MEPENYNNTETWKKNALIAAIGASAVILLSGSTVLLTIGYINAFGNVGLSILGAGAVLYFSSVMLLCASCIWVKNKYFPDETDFTVKPPSRDDTYLVKPVPHSEMVAAELREVAFKPETYEPVPLLSDSTTGSSPIFSPTSTETWLTDNDACFSDSDTFLPTPLSAQHRISKPVSGQRLEMGTHFIYPSAPVRK